PLPAARPAPPAPRSAPPAPQPTPPSPHRTASAARTRPKIMPHPAPTAPRHAHHLVNSYGAAAARVIDRVETLLVQHPELARRMTGMMMTGLTVSGGVSPLGPDGDMVRVLRLLRQVLLFLSMSGSLGLPTRRPDMFPTEASAALGRVAQGPAAAPLDFSALMQAALAQLRGDPELFRNAMSSAMGVPVAPPVPSAEETALLARRGLDRAGHALGTGRFRRSGRRPLSAAERPDPAALRRAVEDLRGGLAGGLADRDLRHSVHGALGICLAELYWLGEVAPLPPPAGADPALTSDRPDAAAATLADAIDHL